MAMEKLFLIKPHEDDIDEIRAYRDEFLEHDDHSHGDSGLYDTPDILHWINRCRLYENERTLPNPNFVEAEQFMLVGESNSEILGMINFRHNLNNKYLAEHGGHIGFAVRPKKRRRRYATVMLMLCLEKCREYGLNKVLITCDADNEASRRTIITCGGKFERIAQTGDEVDERYWITL